MLLICSLAILWKDAKNGHILKHRWSCYCGHYDQFCDICHNGRTYNGHKFKNFMVSLTLLQRLAKMLVSSENRIKKYVIYTKLWPKKIRIEIMTIFYVFLGNFGLKMALPEEALPMWVQSSSLPFWNQESKENGIR